MAVIPTRSASIASGSISSTPSSMMRTSAGISEGMREASVVRVSGAYRMVFFQIPPRCRYSGPRGQRSTIRKGELAVGVRIGEMRGPVGAGPLMPDGKGPALIIARLRGLRLRTQASTQASTAKPLFLIEETEEATGRDRA